MTHLPPIPDAASPPYPAHPAPIPEEQKLATAQAEEEAAAAAEQQREAEQRQQRVTTAIGAGLGTALLVGAAAWGLSAYSRRKPATPARPRRARPDDKSKRGPQDRARVAAGEPYEVAYFARKHRISAADARAIIEEAGNDRQAANKLAQARKGA